MSDFFEPPPAPPAPQRRYRMPPWAGPPWGTLPGVVPLERVIARTDEVAVCVSRLAGYPTGFQFDILTMSADQQALLDPWMFQQRHHPQSSASEDIPPEMLRIGVQFADGSKATNTAGFRFDHGEPPTGPIMHAGGGGGGGGSWHQTQWVWPLPPLGPLVLVCEWPARDIPLTRYELDAEAILDAATRAQVIFADESLPDWPDDDDEAQDVTVIR